MHTTVISNCTMGKF